LVLIDTMLLPYQMAYNPHGHKAAFDHLWLWLMTAFFTVDIMLNFNTAYAAGKKDSDMKKGTLVTDRCRIAAHYIQHWFLLDLMTTVPWWLVADLLDKWSWAAGAFWSVTKYLRVLRILRMLRLAKMARIWDDLEGSLSSFAFLQAAAVLRVLLTICFICHWNACLWWIVGKPSHFLDDFISDDYRNAYEALPHWTTLPRIDFGEVPTATHITWQWIDKEHTEAYVFCCYWTLGVMRTMPTEVTPVNQQERLYVMVFMFLAFSLFGITVAQITQMFFRISERSRTFNEELLAVRTHLRTIDAPAHLRDDVVSYLRHLFDQRRVLAKEHAMLTLLPDHLQDELKYTRVAQHLSKLDLLRALPEKPLHLISDMAEMKCMSRGTILSNRDAIAEVAWILFAGHLQRFPASSETEDGVEIVDGDCLKDADPVRSPFTTVAVICSEVLWIDKEHFFDLVEAEPSFGFAFSRAAKMIASDDEPPATPLIGGSARKPSKSSAKSRSSSRLF